MRHVAVSMLILTGTLSACATTSSLPYVPPRVTIHGVDTAAVKGTLVQRCVEGSGLVEVSTDHQLICSKPMDFSFGSLMYRALATPEYSTNPDEKIRFTFAETSEGVFVSVDMYREFQTAFGQVNRRPITNGNLASQAQQGLDKLKAMLEGPEGANSESTASQPSRTGQSCVACKKIGESAGRRKP
jgi:hypothetical protein